ncbi:MAG: cyclic nucleotide-binding protein [Spartobacteria bacterium]|nr:cyclic nucleotide-binding protein [Spartobacteria bacterium]
MTTDTLRAVPLFESLDEHAAATVCGLLESEDCHAAHTLFRAGDAGDAMYLIESGKVQISMKSAEGEELILAVLGRGDFFGEMALIDGKPRSANATVVEPSRLAVLSRPHFLDFLNATPNVAIEMLTALTRRLRRTDELLRHLATRNVNEEEASHLTFADRAADVIAEFGGSWKFIIASLSIFVLWVAANSFLLTRSPFDPFPFILLNLALNMITALQAPIIMMSQNRQSHKDRLRADLDYKVNLKNELALNEIVRRLYVLERDCLQGAAKPPDDDLIPSA